MKPLEMKLHEMRGLKIQFFGLSNTMFARVILRDQGFQKAKKIPDFHNFHCSRKEASGLLRFCP